MAKLGRPVEKLPKARASITLSPADVAQARFLGHGNLSAGIHRALRIARGTEPVVRPEGHSKRL